MSSSARRPHPRIAWSLAAILTCTATELARAEDRAPETANKTTTPRQAPKQLPDAVLLATAGESAPALDAVIQAKLEELDVVKIVAVPGMDLQAVQLALDCVGETESCLKRVVSSNRAQVLVAPTLQRTSNELVFSVLRFDADDGAMRRALRRHAGSTVESGLLDEVPEMLRELFDLPPPSPPVAAPPPLASVEAPAPDPFATSMPPEEPPEAGVPVGPLVLAGAGVAAIGGGLALGAVMNGTQDDYERMSRAAETPEQVDAALDTRDEGEMQATIANVLLAAGGASLIAAGIWLAVDLSDDSKEPASGLAPMLGPNRAGLVFLHRGDAL